MVFTDHSTTKCLFSSKDAKVRLIRWILLLQEFNLLVKDKNEVQNTVANHLSRITSTFEPLPMLNVFPNDSLMVVGIMPWFADIVNYLAVGKIPNH